MATAPTVPNFEQFNFKLGDKSAVVTKQNGLNAALAQFGNNLKVMTDSINADIAVMKGAYYGPLAEDPTEDPNGEPPEEGDRYYNTVEGVEKSYNGSAWQANEVGAHMAATDPHPQYEFRVMHNTTATRAPNSADDSAAGYAARSTWFDTSQNPPEAYRCIDATEGAAVWVKTTLTLDELGSAAVKDTGTGADNLPTTADADARYAKLAGANDFSQTPTVSGDPIVESDSNAAGMFTRFASGYQVTEALVVYAVTTTAVEGVHRDNSLPEWAFPAPFIEEPSGISVEFRGSAPWGGFSGISATGLTPVFWSASSISSSSVGGYHQASGRWK